ncbi:MAG: DNA polymerase III subunit gamma/tau [Synechococcales cyanobacterium RM1_1_8]|nr:DNA polymerase III subunit gamma/tau [Synechococcales cyanobacterium RM1_1_8]
MAYEPLHHKYRPQTFADLVGQGAIAQTLTNAILQRRIAPAYLFSGPRGTGKTSSARILAKSLNCQASDQPTPQPCGRCEACRSIAAGFALDVIEIDAASNTGVDNIRELIEKAQFAPVQCRYKVYVIDECHMLSTAAFNALLKTLEEPPDRVVFVLATTDPQRVLPTIISRCQRFDYRRIPLEDMVLHLRHIADQELIDIHDDALRLVGQLSQGGLRDAESLLDQLSLLPPPVAIEAVWDLVGAVPERDLLSLVAAIAANQAEAVLDCARQLMDRGREPLIVLQSLASFYRDLLIAKTASQRPDLVAITADTWTQMVQFVQQLDVATILQGQQHLRHSEVQLKNSTQPRLWLEVTLMGLLPAAQMQPQGIAPVLQPASPPAALSAPVTSAPTLAPQAAFPPPAAPRIISAPISVAAPPQPPAAVQAAASSAEAPAPGFGAVVQFPAAAPPAAAPDAGSGAVVNTTPGTTPGTTPDPTPDPTQNIAPALDLGETWKQAIANVEYHSTQTLLNQQSQLMRFDGTTARVAVTQQWLSYIQDKQEAIEQALARVIGKAIKLKLEGVAKKPEAPPAAAIAPVPPTPAPAPAAPPTPAAPKPRSPSSGPPPAAPSPAPPAAPAPTSGPKRRGLHSQA